MNYICRQFSSLVKPQNVILHKRYESFKSAISLDTIYPLSSLKLTTPTKTAVENGQFSGYIPINELDITYSRSSGPGGQNVNTVSTKVDLRFHVQSASWLTDDTKSKLLEKYRTKITKEGFLVFRSDLTRSQHLNLADCLQKLRSVIRTLNISTVKSPDTQEKIRRRQERAVRERLTIKRQRSQIKVDRNVPMFE